MYTVYVRLVACVVYVKFCSLLHLRKVWQSALNKFREVGLIIVLAENIVLNLGRNKRQN
jgi:hypothetical protein